MNLFISNNRKESISHHQLFNIYFLIFPTYSSHLIFFVNLKLWSHFYTDLSKVSLIYHIRPFDGFVYILVRQIMIGKEERIFEPSLFREYLKSKMISLLDSVAGRKLLMLDFEVRTPINLVVEKSMLSQHGVPNEGGILPFQPLPLPANNDQIMIFLKPTGENLLTLKELIDLNRDKGNKRYYPCFWPKRTIICKEFFEINHLNDVVDIRDFSFDLLPLDIDLYSLEMKTLKDMYINNDHSIYSTVAESIHRLQCVFGRVHNFYGKGKAAKAVFQILRLKENQIKIDQNYGDIESVIIIDRNIDFVTPLLKQTVYQGIADEFYGINGGILKVPTAKFDDGSLKEKKTENAYKIIKVNCERDYIYESIRGLSLFGARNILKVKGSEHDQFQEQAGRIRDINQKSAAIKKIRDEKQFLKTHLSLIAVLQEDIKSIRFNKELLLQQGCILQKQSSELVQYYENCIPFDFPIENIIKNMSLQCIINRGIHKKVYGKICEDICITHGFNYIVALTHLANLGIFYQHGSLKDPYPFAELKRQLKLISEAPIDHAKPQDPSFAYGGYVPIAARLVEHAIRNGWRLIQKPLRLLPGETIMPEYSKSCNSHPRPAVVVYFVGGVTYGEIATLRLLGKFLKREIVVATTELINGDSMIRQLVQ